MLDLPSPAVLLAAVLFGCIGTIALIVGRKRRDGRMLLFGAALCLYPYLVGDNVWTTWLIGSALTAAMIYWRDQ